MFQHEFFGMALLTIIMWLLADDIKMGLLDARVRVPVKNSVAICSKVKRDSYRPAPRYDEQRVQESAGRAMVAR